MSVTYSFAIESTQKRAIDPEPNYVVDVVWTKTGVDEDGDAGVFKGAWPFQPDPELDSFIAYEDLQDDTLVQWVVGVIDTSYEAFINSHIASEIAKSKAARLASVPE